MSREDGNRAKVLAELKLLMISLVDGRIEREECAQQVNEVVRKHPWVITDFDDTTNVNPLERIWAEALGIPPVPSRVPLVGN